MNFSSFKLRREAKTGIVLALAIVVLYAIGYFFVSKSFVPDRFIEARQQGAAVGKEIVVMTEESLATLDLIAKEDKNFRFQRALDIVQSELEHSKKARVKAIELTKALDDMARSAAEIKPTKARNLAMDAVRQEVGLITRLIVYNDLLNTLLQTLEFKFSGDIRYDAEDVQLTIKNMNTEAREVNNLNNLFNEKMREFDSLLNL